LRPFKSESWTYLCHSNNFGLWTICASTEFLKFLKSWKKHCRFIRLMSKRHHRLIKKPENSFEVSKKRSKCICLVMYLLKQKRSRFICLMYLLKQKRGMFTKNPEKSFKVSKKKLERKFWLALALSWLAQHQVREISQPGRRRCWREINQPGRRRCWRRRRLKKLRSHLMQCKKNEFQFFERLNTYIVCGMPKFSLKCVFLTFESLQNLKLYLKASHLNIQGFFSKGRTKTWKIITTYK